jgi:hypothetical protein
MSFDAMFASIATGFAGAFGAPYYDAVASWPGTPVIDAGGSITTPASPVTAGCQCQVDIATDAMRSVADFLATDVRLLLLGLTAIDPTATITIAAGPHFGTWKLMSVARDPAGIGYECRGRRV